MSRSLKALLLLICVASLPARAAGAVGVDDGDRLAIRQVIEAQLDAFRRDDGIAAYNYATPSIRRSFPTPSVFMEMVRRQYRPVYRPRAVEFGDIVEFRGAPAQIVHLTGPDNVPVIATYPMQRQNDGRWLINGCFLRRSGDRAV